MREIHNIVIHCSAGFSLIPSIENFWYKPKSKGGLGWKNPGYHIIIYEDGTIWYVTKNKSYSTDKSKWYPQIVTNGVKGYNSNIINICYIGGVENIGTKEKPIWKASDTRTDAQKWGIEKCIIETIYWLKDNGKDISKNLGIVGHRDYSIDNNKNGVIESWERIKECPSFDVIPEYGWYGSKDRYGKLPTVK